MAQISLSGGNEKDKNKNKVNEIKYPTTSTGAQGSVTGSNVFGSAIPNKVGAVTQKPVTQTPAVNTSGKTPAGTTGGNKTAGTTGAGSSQSTTEKKGEFYTNSKSGATRKISTTDMERFIRELGLGGSTGADSIYNQFTGPQMGQNINNAMNGIKDKVNTEKAETSINELKNKYSETLRQQHDYAAEQLRKERDDALRENWILQQQAEAALPEQLAAAGMNGGATETTLANLLARYQGNRNDIRNEYMDNLGDLAIEHSAEQAEAERAYNEQWLDYLLSLAKMEEEYEQKKALAAMQQK